MKYIHAIDLDNFYPCLNLRNDGKLRTPNFIAAIDSGFAAAHHPIEQVSIDDLRKNGPRQCGVTPRTGSAIIKAAILRRGQKMVNGYGKEILVTDETREFLMKCSDVELEFERVRREVSPNSVSRLSCLWLAERTPDGEQHIKNMLGNNIYILNVCVTRALNISRADTGWFDAYWDEGRPEYIVNYLSGEFFSSSLKWEYLLDGEIKVEDAEQLEYIKEHGTVEL